MRNSPMSLSVLALGLFASRAAASLSACSALDAECVLSSARGTPEWVAHFSSAPNGSRPEQFHVNYGATPDAAAIRWTTSNASATAAVRWGTAAGALTHTALGRTDRYIYSAAYTSPWIHTANITGLPLGARIYYQVGDVATGLSPVMSFMSNPGVGPIYPYRTGEGGRLERITALSGALAAVLLNARPPPHSAFVADIGEAESANTTITRVLEANALGLVDSVVINGDISYATGCEAKGCTTWDAYCRMASPLASSVPWMVTIGESAGGACCRLRRGGPPLLQIYSPCTRPY